MKEESLYDGSNPYGDDGSNESALWEGKRAERSSKLWKSVCVIGISSVLTGWSLVQLNAVTGQSNAIGALSLSTTDMSVCTAVLYCSAGLASLWVNRPLERWGRRQTLLWNNVFFSVGGFLTCFSNFYAILLGRAVMGVGAGVALTAVPTLVSEIAPTNERGAMGATNMLFVNCGCLFSAMVSYVFVVYVQDGWRYSNLLYALLPLSQVYLRHLVPESPRWSRSEDDREKHEADVAAEGDDGKAERPTVPTWWQLREPLAIGTALAVLQPLSGNNIFTSYSTAIFTIAGIENAILGTVGVVAVLVLASAAAVLLIERLGRRTLLQLSSSIMSVCAVVSGAALWSTRHDETAPQFAGFVCLAASAGFLGGYALGLGPIMWVLIAEIFPTSRRSVALGTLAASNALTNLVVVFTALLVINGIAGCYYDASIDDDDRCSPGLQRQGVGGLMLGLGAVCACIFVFVTVFVNETRGLSLEVLERHYCLPCLPRTLAAKKTKKNRDHPERARAGQDPRPPPPRAREERPEERPLLTDSLS